MDCAEIVSTIRKRFPDINPLVTRDLYPDHFAINVSRQAFKDTCITLHTLLGPSLMMLFAVDQRQQKKVFVIHAVFADNKSGRWISVSCDIPEDSLYFDSLAKDIYAAGLFEREIWEMFGIEPKGNPDLRRLRLHDEVCPAGFHPLRKDVDVFLQGKVGAYKHNRVEGEGIFEVPVGPVHAGIIGPGHFRFSVAGEPIINLEIRLGFTHRGVEKLLESRRCDQAVALTECVSGDSCFAHSMAFVRAAEKISGITVAAHVTMLRAIFLELERIYNHVNDIGGIAVDVGFSFPAAYASVIKEAVLQLNEKLTGSRYLKHVNTVGGVGIGFNDEKKTLLLSSLKGIKSDLKELESILETSVSFMDRVDTTGVLKKKTAEDLGIRGLAGRASGLPVDLRKYFSGVYRQVQFHMVTQEAGDVLARLRARMLECRESLRMIKEWTVMLPEVEKSSQPARIEKGQALGYVEGWRGPVLYWLETGPEGLIERCKIVDPSFLNWQGLSFAALGNIIPDFPVCNKSFDLSYSGGDL